MQSDVIKAAPSLSEVSIDMDSQLSDCDIFIGFVTRQTLGKLENEGDCLPPASKKFFASVSDLVFDEFVEYQLLDHSDIQQSIWETASEKMEGSDGVFLRMDALWGYLGSVKTGDGCNLKFKHLSRVAKLVLTLPHSSAAEERVFSLVRLNKTPYRSSLSLDGTLSSILTVKMHNPEPC